ncbi:MAG: tetratricopeptide repeat protein [Phycisphaerales bacterium]|nr:MAG: tetratricopeptide repeat protein [Phycisphaerales bacterium]
MKAAVIAQSTKQQKRRVGKFRFFPRGPIQRVQRVAHPTRLILFLTCLAFCGDALGAGVKQTHSTAALRSMARVYMACGGYEKAQPLLETALNQAQKTNASDSELCACLIDLAYLYKEQGNLNQAETMCRLGLALQEKVHQPNHPYVANTLRILSEICRELGRYEEARTTLERAMTIIRKVRPEDGQEIAPLKVDMARLLMARGDYTDAESHFTQAIGVIETSFGPEHLYTAKVRSGLATLYSLQGRYPEAQTLIQRALPVYEKVHGPDHHFLIPLWLVQARISQAKGETAQAQRLLDKSLRVARKSGTTKEVARLEQYAREIRVLRPVAYAPAETNTQ